MNEIELGRYQLQRRLGAGGTAEVWLATDLATGRHVAVKRLLPSAADDDAMVERLQREAVAAASVRHPNIVPVLDAGPGVVVFALVDGEPLAEVLRRGRLPAEDVTRLAVELGDALAAVHAAGLVHGDVTPSNVTLDRDGRASLADFGAAEAGVDGPFGTPGFVAPELLAGGMASPASDVWSLGAVLHEALAGVPVRLGDGGAPPRLGPDALPTLIAEMLDPDPAQRPAAATVVRTLTPGPMAVTQPIDGALAAPVAVPTTAAEPTLGRVRGVPPRRTSRAARARLGLVGVAGALLAAGLVLAAAGPVEPLGAKDSSPPVPSAPVSTPSPSPTPTPSPTPKPSTSAPAHRGPGHARGHAKAKPRGGKGHGHGRGSHGGPPKHQSPGHHGNRGGGHTSGGGHGGRHHAGHRAG